MNKNQIIVSRTGTISSVPYNQKLIPKLLDVMEAMSQTYDCTWFTTIVQLECQFVPEQPNCEYQLNMKNELRNMLQSDSKRVSRERL